MNKIEELTEAQEEDLIATRNKWLAIGRSTARIDKEASLEVISKMYNKIGKEKPIAMYLSSPIMCLLAYTAMKSLKVGQLRSQLGSQLWSQLRSQLESQLESQLRSQLSNVYCGSQWCSWEVFYDFCNKIGVNYSKEEKETLSLWLMQSKECHWWFPYDGIVLISDRPTICTVDNNGRLHDEKTQAIEYSDGWGIWSLHGVRMEEWQVTTPAEKLDPSKILKEKNVEQRRELIRKMGIEILLDKLPNKVVDKKDTYELISINIPDLADNCRYLKMVNPSIGVFHLEGVARECETVQQALNWRAGDIKQNWEPAILT